MNTRRPLTRLNPGSRLTIRRPVPAQASHPEKQPSAGRLACPARETARQAAREQAAAKVGSTALHDSTASGYPWR